MSEPVILFEGVGKKFRRTAASNLRYGAEDLIRRLLRLAPGEALRPGEFWALHDISFSAERGECIGIIGPNGAGKSTLLKLAHRDHRPDHGRVAARGQIKSLLRLGDGLRPEFTGRENIFLQCAELGLGKAEIDGKLDAIVAFAGLEKALDKPVKHYSDGMYARLEFSVATAVPADILLIDEVLAVGDMAFQMRCLERLEQLKRAGTTILFVSHSEMNVRQIADRCLLLFDGEALGFGETEALFRKYYESVGFVNRSLKPLGAAPDSPADFAGAASIRALTVLTQEAATNPKAATGKPVEFSVDYEATQTVPEASVVLQFWSPAGLLMVTFDSSLNRGGLALSERGEWRVSIPFLPLTAGLYRVAGGFRAEGRWLSYAGHLQRLVVVQEAPGEHLGLFAIPGQLQERRAVPGRLGGP